VCYSAVRVRVVVLGEEDSLSRVLKAKGDDEVDGSSEAPTLYHLGVLSHIDSVVDRDVVLGDGIGEVLCEPSLELSATRSVECKLSDHSTRLDQGSDQFVGEAREDREGEAMTHIFGEECDYLFGLGLGGLVVAALDVGIELFCPLLRRELRFEFVVHSGGEDSSEERVDRMLAEDAVELLDWTELGPETQCRGTVGC
jgi:hypothetical protein